MTDLNELISKDKTYLYDDVGGGSTELSLFSRGNIIHSKSFKIGTVRLLNNSKQENKEKFKHVARWIKKYPSKYNKITLIGLGSNINKLFKISGRTEGAPISYIYLNTQYQLLKKMSYRQ